MWRRRCGLREHREHPCEALRTLSSWRSRHDLYVLIAFCPAYGATNLGPRTLYTLLARGKRTSCAHRRAPNIHAPRLFRPVWSPARSSRHPGGRHVGVHQLHHRRAPLAALDVRPPRRADGRTSPPPAPPSASAGVPALDGDGDVHPGTPPRSRCPLPAQCAWRRRVVGVGVARSPTAARSRAQTGALARPSLS